LKTKKLTGLMSAIGLGLALASAPALAAVQYYFPKTAFQDDDLDFIIDANQNGVADVGDRIITVFEFQNTQGILTGQGPTAIAPEELTGVADVTVVGVVPGTNTFILAPTGATGLLSGFAAGTAAAVWIDASPDLDVINSNCGTRAQCLALAGLGGTDGSTLYATFGFFGDPDANWTATPIGSAFTLTSLQGGGSSSNFGSYNYALQIGVNNTGFTFGDQSCAPFCAPGGNGLIQVTGSGNVLGGEGLDPAQWTARSDNDTQLVPLQVPEPGSVALLGLALAGIGLMRRRDRS
jgi:hypothetical protein